MTSQSGYQSGADAALIDQIVDGNKILAKNKIVDAFGHLSARHPKDPNLYLIARHLAPQLVKPEDIVSFTLDNEPAAETSFRYYSERFIHGAIYRARPDVQAIVHCHAPALIPFGATRYTLKPIFHMCGFLGYGCAHYDIRDASGPTDMLVRDAIRAASLAQALGDKPMVLMRGHGATIVGSSIVQAVHRSYYATINAQLQMDALRLGEPIYLEEEEAKLSAAANDHSADRAWALWKTELDDGKE
jgi:ribulose-5-phosphate 4-epimerase/fuculose-1-phosphate aldolase